MKRLILALFLLASPLLYTGCESDKPAPDLDWTLLENIVWVSTYELQGMVSEQFLTFYPHGFGYELIMDYYADKVDVQTYEFDWFFSTHKKNTLILDYWDYEYEFKITDIQPTVLSGILDGEPVIFVAVGL